MNLVRKVSAVAVVVALGAFSHAAPCLQAKEGSDGRGIGRWVQVSARATLVEARLANSMGLMTHRLNATLIGEESGHIYGELVQLPLGNSPNLLDLRLSVEGDYIDMGDRRLYVRAQILLD